MAKKLRCYLTFHRWQRLQAEGGGAYMRCRDCGKFKDIPDHAIVGGGGIDGGGFSGGGDGGF
jgi:hypothetical protein